jgi:glycosyltransferase involved in cell wall biosynthesis
MTKDWGPLASALGGVVCVSTADFNAQLWTNKQHVMSRLARFTDVVYVESLGLREPRPSLRDAARVARRFSRRQRARPTGVFSPEIVAPLILPLHRWHAARAVNRRLLRLQLRRRIERLARPRVLWTYAPVVVDELDLDDFDVVLYHCVDDLASVPGVPRAAIHETEARMAARSDVVIASSPALAERLRPLNASTRVVPNVADTAHFAAALQRGPIPDDIARIPGPRAVFAGALTDYKIDWDLVCDVADLAPDWQFVFIGPVGDEQRMSGWKTARTRSNCRFLGHRRYEDLPAYFRAADAGIVPYVRTVHTDAVYPLKFVEYLAAGLPVVSTDLPALSARPELPVRTARSAQEFVAALTASRDRDREGLSAAAAGHSWDFLLTEILSDVQRCSA